jgi:sterol desaturase/sphingolipid hydroxylase (fatty acid hydroxylase superfamily)
MRRLVGADTENVLITDVPRIPRTPERRLVRPALLLGAAITVAVVVLARAQLAPADAGGSLLPVNTDVLLASSVVTMIVVEAVVRARRRLRIDGLDAINSMTIGLGYLGIQVAAGKLVAFGAYLWVFDHLRLLTLSWRSPLVWVGYWIVGELASYWIHRAEHRVRALWASHQVHHSSEDFSFTTAVRMPWTEMAYKPLTGLWAPLLGFPPVMYPVMGAISLMIGQLQHTGLIGRLGPLERILMTPSNHRVHHASNPAYLDRNFGGHTVIFDRLFGTYVAEFPAEPPVYGLTHPVTASGTLGLVAGGFPQLWRDLRDTPGARAKLALCAGPPAA